ncbi:MAG: bifunctional hydroxymethylpyrimidine kinase/phosphomethylpyrimidine kinase [Clostridiales bacterium]|nr:bifunctional hydroxymethylpyrimidine kinase/phosphomethylpyrimidine kinase [Clostridiales bacterium]
MKTAMKGAMRNVLSIAGSDSGGGAGIQADLKTMCAMGVYGMTAITAVTAQNTQEVRDVQEIGAQMVESQISAVFEDMRVDAVKVGMVSSAEIMRAVERSLKKYGARNVVVDPVMVSKSGYNLLKPDAVEKMREFIACASVVTPNIPEAELLCGFPIKTGADMRAAAERLVGMGAKSALVKGGHRAAAVLPRGGAGGIGEIGEIGGGNSGAGGNGDIGGGNGSGGPERNWEGGNSDMAGNSDIGGNNGSGGFCGMGGGNGGIGEIGGGSGEPGHGCAGGGEHPETSDDLLYADGEFLWLPAKRIDTKNTHGTGCTLSAAIACRLALGDSVADAARAAKAYITQAIADAEDIGKGASPVGHLAALYRKAGMAGGADVTMGSQAEARTDPLPDARAASQSEAPIGSQADVRATAGASSTNGRAASASGAAGVASVTSGTPADTGGAAGVANSTNSRAADTSSTSCTVASASGTAGTASSTSGTPADTGGTAGVASSASGTAGDTSGAASRAGVASAQGRHGGPPVEPPYDVGAAVRAAARTVDRVRELNPLIHCITNYITTNDCANILLSFGASPAMCDALDEAYEFAMLSSALYINFGTYLKEQEAAAIKAALGAKRAGRPIVVDPVGCAAISRRKGIVDHIHEVSGISIIKGNLSEIMALSGGAAQAKGVDGADEVAGIEGAAMEVARKYGCTVAATGKVDVITDGARLAHIHNGVDMLKTVTGAGCMAGALCGATAAAAEDGDMFAATIAAIATMGITGELAARSADLPGSFRVAMIDGAHTVDGKKLLEMGRIRC